MNLSVSHTFLLVHDQDEALKFYRDVLGFEVRNDVMFGEHRWLSISSPTQLDFEIVLESPEMRMAGSGTDAKVLRDLLAKGVVAGLIFTTDDCDATFETLRAAGAEVTQEPISQPYGVRDCGFRDPSGNNIRFSEILKG
jgi:uncharacterized glyoxalase superfamily protein PhnB